MGFAHGNILCGVNPCVKDQIHKCKEMGGKRQTPHGQPGGGGASVSLRKGVLEKACWGGAAGNVVSLGSVAIWDRDGNNVCVWGSAQGSRQEKMLGESGEFLASM